MLTRNIVGLAGAAALYVAIAYGLQFLELEGRNALFLLIAFQVGFGLSGYFLFSGSTSLRAACVFLVIFVLGLGLEYFRPDPRHEHVQVFVMTAFGLLAAISTHGGRYLEALWSRRGGTRKS